MVALTQRRVLQHRLGAEWRSWLIVLPHDVVQGQRVRGGGHALCVDLAQPLEVVEYFRQLLA